MVSRPFQKNKSPQRNRKQNPNETTTQKAPKLNPNDQISSASCASCAAAAGASRERRAFWGLKSAWPQRRRGHFQSLFLPDFQIFPMFFEKKNWVFLMDFYTSWNIQFSHHLTNSPCRVMGLAQRAVNLSVGSANRHSPKDPGATSPPSGLLGQKVFTLCYDFFKGGFYGCSSVFYGFSGVFSGCSGVFCGISRVYCFLGILTQWWFPHLWVRLWWDLSPHTGWACPTVNTSQDATAAFSHIIVSFIRDAINDCYKTMDWVCSSAKSQ